MIICKLVALVQLLRDIPIYAENESILLKYLIVITIRCSFYVFLVISKNHEDSVC